VESISAAMLLKALDGLSLRASATAENIANSGTPGYRPAHVEFEQMLASASHGSKESVEAVRPAITRGPDGEPLRLDMELAAASTTAMRYSALIELLGRQIHIQSLSVQGNR
jgi:flagellar basal-body rod protein FlgB